MNVRQLCHLGGGLGGPEDDFFPLGVGIPNMKVEIFWGELDSAM